MTHLAINDDQANSLLDLVSDQIRVQRRYLRHDSLNRTHITALTHFRNLKRLILAKEQEMRRQTDRDEQEANDINFAEVLRDKLEHRHQYNAKTCNF